MKVTFAATAKADLRAIGWYIADDNVPRSITFVEELRDRCLSLSERPNRFPEAVRHHGRSLRKMTHGGYLIFYAVDAAGVDVLRIVHGSRDWLRLFDA